MITFEKILSIPKSFFLSLKYFPLKDALKLPIFVRFNTRIRACSGSIETNSPIHFGMIKMGFRSVGVYDEKYERSIWEVRGTIRIVDIVGLGTGSRLSVGEKALVSFGKNFSNTASAKIISTSSISFGENVVVSWDCLIMDTDWHETINTVTKKVNEKEKPIIIGNNVWLCTRSLVLKGSVIPNGCIVGANAVVSKRFEQENVAIVGNPCVIAKENVTFYRKNK